MRVFAELFGAFLASAGLLALLWTLWGWLLLPNLCPTAMVVSPEGRAESLEQTVRALLWLRRAGLWRGEIRVESRRLTAEGAELARRLAARYGLRLDGAPAGEAGAAEDQMAREKFMIEKK